MPRASAEARSATAFRAGGKPPPVPHGMPERAGKIWYEIVRAKPLGLFDAGSLPLLEQYCRTLAQAQAVAEMMDEADVGDQPALERRLVKLNASCTSLATKLRLTVQALIDRRSRMIDEKGVGEKSDDNLLGGKAVWGAERLRVVS